MIMEVRQALLVLGYVAQVAHDLETFAAGHLVAAMLLDHLSATAIAMADGGPCQYFLKLSPGTVRSQSAGMRLLAGCVHGFRTLQARDLPQEGC